MRATGETDRTDEDGSDSYNSDPSSSIRSVSPVVLLLSIRGSMTRNSSFLTNAATLSRVLVGLKAVCAALVLASLVSVGIAQTPMPPPPVAPDAGEPTLQDPTTDASQDPGSQDADLKLVTDLVLLSAVVTKGPDSDRMIPNLKLNEFEILDDGVRQEIAFFGNENYPLDVIFLFDASQSTKFRQQFQREAVAAFLRNLIRPKDNAAIYWFSNKVHVEQDFTALPGPLLAAIDRIPAGGATSLYSAVVAASNDMIVRSGRRAIVILSDGRDTFSSARLFDALKAAQIADVVIYGVNTSYAAWAVTPQRKANDPLEYLASQTGGEVFYSANEQDIEKVLSRLSGRLRDRYVLGFYPSAPGGEGRFRRLKVNVTKKDAYVMTRSGYYGR